MSPLLFTRHFARKRFQTSVEKYKAKQDRSNRRWGPGIPGEDAFHAPFPVAYSDRIYRRFIGFEAVNGRDRLALRVEATLRRN